VNGNNGIVIGATPAMDRFGAAGKAFRFDGTSSYISIPDSPSLRFSSTDAFTVSLWFYADGALPSLDADTLISKYTNVSGDFFWEIRLHNGPGHANEQYFYAGRQNAYQADCFSPSAYQTGAWVNMVCSYSGNSLKMYLNGNLSSQTTYSDPFCPGDDTMPLTLGNKRIGTDNYWYSGLLDDIRIYNNVLNEAQISNLYHEGGWSGLGPMVNVPAGSFQRDATATNVSTITTAYWMSKHEITRAQFSTIMVTDPSNITYSGGNTDPVQMTNWYHAIAYCNKLSIAEGLEQVYSVTGINFGTLTYAGIPITTNASWDAATANRSASGYRLPTETEWMWAAMGATSDRYNGNTGIGTNTSGYLKIFAGSSGSNVIGDYAVFGYGHGETGATTSFRSNPVGSKLPNEIGLYDMTGNVFEWNWDWDAPYPSGLLTDYLGAASGTNRMLRGGSWGFHSSNCTVAYRDYPFYPYGQNLNFGFRVVRP
jgi:formylglycine-generating enzyme required for sulfatase activity